jgi:hypothetical protein
MGQPRFNIDTVSDDEFFAVTEALALSGQVMEEKGSATLLVISLSTESGADAIMAGSLGEQALEQLERLFEQLKERALEETEDDALVLHLEEPAD